MELWVARDKNGDLCLYFSEPIQDDTLFDSRFGEGYFLLPIEEFPEVTWENSPKQVELKIFDE